MKPKKIPESSVSEKPKTRKARRNTTPSPTPSPAGLKNSLKPKGHDRRPDAEYALSAIGIEPEDLELVPKITDTLSRCFGVKDGNAPRAAIVNYLAASGLPVATAFLECWQSLSKMARKHLPIEAICLKAEVSPLEIMGAVLQGANALSKRESALLTVINHPEVVKATIRRAKGKYGTADSKMLHEAVGYLPAKQGSTVFINLLGGKPDTESSGDEDADKSWDEAFPRAADKLEKLGDRRRLLAEKN